MCWGYVWGLAGALGYVGGELFAEVSGFAGGEGCEVCAGFLGVLAGDGQGVLDAVVFGDDVHHFVGVVLGVPEVL